jgi:hypothetical protein
MLSTARNALLIALLLFPACDAFSQQAPAPSQPTENSEQGGPAEHKNSNNAQYRSSEKPSVFNFISPDGLNKISAYCANKPDKDPDKWLHEKFVCDVHITDVAIAIFTGLLVLVTVPLTLVGLCQSRIASKTAKRQLRAYVWGETNRNANIDAEPFVVVTNIKNSGETPAYDVCCWSQLRAYDNPLPQGFVFEAAPHRIDDAKYVVNPGSLHSILTGTEPVLTPEEKTAIKAGNTSLYIWGEIQYRDAFAKRRKTRFRLLWIYTPLTLGMWSYCNEGNDAT